MEQSNAKLNVFTSYTSTILLNKTAIGGWYDV